MFHMQIELLDAEADIAVVVRRLNFDLAAMNVQIIRHYGGERLGPRKWNLIFRDVTADNWERLCRIVARVLRNQDCRYTIKHPTVRGRSVGG